MEGLGDWFANIRIPRYDSILLLLVVFAAGYVFAQWWSRPRDATILAQICARVDYVNSLQEN